MNIVIFGPPGAGKGTQSDFIVSKYNLFQLSTGDILRQEIKNKSEVGLKIQKIINSGNLVSDDTVDRLVENIISDKKYKSRIIFDGYPRNLSQAKALDELLIKYKQKIDLALNLVTKLETIKKRISGRSSCSKCGNCFASSLENFSLSFSTIRSISLQSALPISLSLIDPPTR